MAQFLKVETLAAGEAEVLIPIDKIGGMLATSDGTDTTLVISLTSPGATAKYTVVVADPAGGLDAMYEAFNKAIVANPGGVVSTVVPPLTTAQAPAAQSGESGSIKITQPAVYTQFASCTFALS
jgi:hypothetical protein|tara:strand:- start:721 stop:1092 length:372 start_codon:yes stop_codon:yes gene_type:complete